MRKKPERMMFRLKEKQEVEKRQETLPNLALSDGSGGDLVKYLCCNACWEVVTASQCMCMLLCVCVYMQAARNEKRG